MKKITNETSPATSVRNLLTVQQFAEKYPAFSQSALRHLIFDSNSNEFDSVIRRIGKRKILLDEEAFFVWVDEQQKTKEVK